MRFLCVLWATLTCLASDACGQAAAERPAKLAVTTTDQGLLVAEGDAKVLFYQRQPRSLEGAYQRANYVHPLYDLDGNVITEDFPRDHRHHRGIFWAWHQVRVGGRKIGDPWACQDFSWDVRDVQVQHSGQGVTLTPHVLWKSPLYRDDRGRPQAIVEERTAITIHPAEPDRRVIDFQIALRAAAPEVSLGGSEDVKGYGGFSTRFRLPPDLRFVGEKGVMTPQVTSVDAGRWLDMSARFGDGEAVSGATILTHPTLPGFPQQWILRQQRSMQNPVCPGRDAVPLPADEPLVLRYRLVLHRGAAEPDLIRRWQQEYEGSRTIGR